MRYTALALSWVAAVAVVVWSAAWPDPFVRHGAGLPATSGYPAQGVFWTVAIISAQVALIGCILRPASYRHSWGRALAAAAVAVVFVVLGGLSSQYTPPYYLLYLWWSVLMALVLTVLFAFSLLARLRAAGGACRP